VHEAFVGLKLPVEVLPLTLGGLLPVILVLLSIHIAFRQKRWLTLLVLFVELGLMPTASWWRIPPLLLKISGIEI
jgi:hypothetical protein